VARVAVIQTVGPWTGPEAVRARTVALLQEAARMGAHLAVLPELCTISYDFGTREDVLALSESLDGPSVAAWQEVARRFELFVVAGLPERAGSELYNSAVLVGPQGVVGVYRKAHLYGREREVFDPGSEGFRVWRLPVGQVGVLLCYDLRFAEAVRILLLRGAHLLCVPTTWTDLGKPQPWDDRGWCGANYLAAGHAYGNRMWVACADRAGWDGRIRTLGCSAIFAPSGYAVAGPALPEGEAILLADCDLAAVEGMRRVEGADLVADRRPDLYRELVDDRR